LYGICTDYRISRPIGKNPQNYRIFLTSVSTLQPPDEAKQLAEAVDTETGQVVKKRKVKAQKDAAEIFNLMEKTWKTFKFLSPRKQFQIRYAKVSTF
jgi:hypothetical protein